MLHRLFMCGAAGGAGALRDVGNPPYSFAEQDFPVITMWEDSAPHAPVEGQGGGLLEVEDIDSLLWLFSTPVLPVVGVWKESAPHASVSPPPEPPPSGSQVLLGRFKSRPAPPTTDQAFYDWHNNFETWLGREVKVSVDGLIWTSTGTEQQQMQTMASASFLSVGRWGAWMHEPGTSGRVHMMHVPLGVGNGSGSGSNPSTVLQAISVGALVPGTSTSYDFYWQTIADRCESWNLLDCHIRLGWEMDGTWYAWGHAGPGGVQAPFFAAAFRRVVDVMRARKPNNNWKFGICPTDRNLTTAWLNQIYPGDSYVSFCGVDSYDTAHQSGGSYAGKSQAQRITEFNNVVWPWRLGQLNILRAFAAAHGKYLVFPEWGLQKRPPAAGGDDEGGNDNTAFIQNMFDWFTNPANNVQQQCYFDVNPSAKERIAISPDSSTEFPNSSTLYKTLFQNE